MGGRGDYPRVGHEMASDDGVENHEDGQGQREEQRDGEEKEEGGPEGVCLGETGGHDGSIEVLGVAILSDHQDGAGNMELERGIMIYAVIQLKPDKVSLNKLYAL